MAHHQTPQPSHASSSEAIAHFEIEGVESVPSAQVDLRLLASELQSLHDVVQELQAFVRGLEEQQDDECDTSCQGVIDGYRALLGSINTSLRDPSDPSIRETTAAAAAFRSRLSLALATSNTVGDIAQHLRLIGKTQCQHELKAIANASLRAPLTIFPTHDTARSPPSPQEVASWLALFNSPELDREPDDHFQESLNLAYLRKRVPHYSRAAAQWPRFAELYWPAVGNSICALFRTPISYNLIQWALEYVRETLPDIFGARASSPDALLGLTDALCDGTVSPLHLAAALGLPTLSSYLLAQAAVTQQFTDHAALLLCALVGPQALGARARPDVFASPLHNFDATEERVDTISRLLDAGADCKNTHRWNGSNEVSMTVPSFWAALYSLDESIFQRVVSRGPALNDAFKDLVRRSTTSPREPDPISLWSRLITIAFDHWLTGPVSEAGSSLSTSFDRDVQDWMGSWDQSFAFGDEGPRLHQISDDAFPEFLMEFAMGGQDFTARRLSLDHRFDPNPRVNGSTPLEEAVQADNMDMVDLLFERGASPSATNGSGQLFLSMVESTAMLSKLVLEHGVSTASVDAEGRNVWHYMAASNDPRMLGWLAENDSRKGRNLVTRDSCGNTPLADSFGMIDDLRAEGSSPLKTPPLAAHLLLDQSPDPACLSSATPLTHLAAAWGDLKLVDGLTYLEADFGAVDKRGCSVLHYLNLAATPELVRRLQSRLYFEGYAVTDSRGHSPLERMVLNTMQLWAHSNERISERRRESAAGAFSELINDKLMDHRGDGGKDCWSRFSSVVFPEVSRAGIEVVGAKYDIKDLLTRLLQRLGERGVFRDHEQQTGRSALFALSCWEADGEHFACVLKYCDPHLAQAFYGSDKAIGLMMRVAEAAGPVSLLKTLTDHGVPPHVEPVDYPDWGEFPVCTPLEAAFFQRDHLPLVRILLEGMGPQHLVERRESIYAALLSTRNDHTESLKLLLERGLPPNPLHPYERAPLVMAAWGRSDDLARVLLQHGADPNLGAVSSNAVEAAVQTGSLRTLALIMEHIEPNFDWFRIRPALTAPNEREEYNLLHFACKAGSDLVLTKLLRETPLAERINDASPMERHTPAHLAAIDYDGPCLGVLQEYGADMGAVDKFGRTPLHLLIKPKRLVPLWPPIDEAIVAFLLNIDYPGPDPLSVRDSDGKTPLDYAMESPGKAAVQVLYKHAPALRGKPMPEG